MSIVMNIQQNNARENISMCVDQGCNIQNVHLFYE